MFVDEIIKEKETLDIRGDKIEHIVFRGDDDGLYALWGANVRYGNIGEEVPDGKYKPHVEYKPKFMPKASTGGGSGYVKKPYVEDEAKSLRIERMNKAGVVKDLYIAGKLEDSDPLVMGLWKFLESFADTETPALVKKTGDSDYSKEVKTTPPVTSSEVTEPSGDKIELTFSTKGEALGQLTSGKIPEIKSTKDIVKYGELSKFSDFPSDNAEIAVLVKKILNNVIKERKAKK